MPRNRVNRLMLAALSERVVPLVHCHAHSLAHVLPNGYPYKHARVHVSHVGNHDSSVFVVGKIGVFPVRIRGILMRFPRLNDGCLVALRAIGGRSRVVIRIRLDSLSASGCVRLRGVDGTVAHRLGSRVLMAPGLQLMGGNSLPRDRKGTIEMGSLQSGGWAWGGSFRGEPSIRPVRVIYLMWARRLSSLSASSISTSHVVISRSPASTWGREKAIVRASCHSSFVRDHASSIVGLHVA